MFNSWANGNAQGGARFANSPAGGIASGLSWDGGGFRLNGVAGLILDKGTHDMVVNDAYFVQNDGPGIDATSGISLVQSTGFENNTGAGAIVQGPGNFTDNTFSSYGPQTAAVGGYLTGGKVTLTGNGNEYYGPGPDQTVLANVQGNGTLAIAGGGNVIVDPRISVTGGHPIVGGTTAPIVTEHLVNDTGISSTDLITSVAAITGTSDPRATVHFAVDDTAIPDSATADANGMWSFMPTGLADGAHTIAASEVDAAGNTGSASLTFTLDTQAPVPVFTGGTSANGLVTITGTTGEAGDQVSLYGDTGWLAFVTTASDGTFTYTMAADTTVSHSFGANATDIAGNEGHGSGPFVVGPAALGLPAFTGMTDSNGTVALKGATGEAGDTIWIYDGNNWIGGTTTDNSGNWSFATTASPNSIHSFGFNGTDLAGSIIQGTNKAILGSSKADSLAGGAGNDIINGKGGNDTIAGSSGEDRLTGGAGNDTFAYKAAGDSTPVAPDTITDFSHGHDEIDFTTIPGIGAAHGVPTFQGNITGGATLNAHNVSFMEVGSNTLVLANTSGVAEMVTAGDTHAANMEIVLAGVHLGLTAGDFHHSDALNMVNDSLGGLGLLIQNMASASPMTSIGSNGPTNQADGSISDFLAKPSGP